MAFSKEKAHERAEKFAAKGQHDRAAKEYQSIVDADPKDIRAWLMLADCLVRCGDRAGAVERYLQVAGFYAAQKQPQKALAVYRQVVNLDARRLDVHQKIAQLNLELGRIPDAVAILEQLGQAQLQAGNVAEAATTFEAIANAEPAAVGKRLRVAELYSRERQVQKAIEHFRIAGEQLLVTGRKADFVRVAERLIYHDNDDRPTIRALARVYLELGDGRRALMKLNSLLHADPHDREGLELLAETFLALDKPDKAVSVAVELVRQLQAVGPELADEVLRVARRAHPWDRNNAELAAIVRAAGDPSPAPASAAPTPVVQDVSETEMLDDGEIEELDEDVEILPSDSGAIAGVDQVRGAVRRASQSVAATAAPSMTQSVLSEVDTAPRVEADGLDFDKVLFEARVYIKYRLFEHAIEHVQDLLARDPDHVGALALRARALGELGRAQEAADMHVHVARLVSDRDPKLAREHIDAALAEVPLFRPAIELRAVLDDTSGPRPLDTGPVAVDDVLLGTGDSGTFDVIGDHDSAPVRLGTGGHATVVAEDEPEFDIAMAEAEPEAVTTRPIAVENRFGLSDARPLPGPDGIVAGGSDDVGATEMIGHEAADRTPAFGYRPAAPPEPGAPVPVEDRGRVGFDPPPRARPVTHRGPTASDREFDDARGRERPVAAPVAEIAFDHSVETSADENITEERDVAQPKSPIPPPATVRRATPVMPTPPRAPQTDLGDEIAEVRFYLDQGLEDDARNALAELERRHPGHPEIAAVRSQLEHEAEPPVQRSGANPLVTFTREDEDEEEDAYLSAIFGEAPAAKPARPKERQPEIRASAGAEPGDAATAYDLGVAYREMGLVDDAIAQFELAARDPLWEARAWVMAGTLRVHRGEPERALADLRRAIDAATNEAELYEAKYELAALSERLGDIDAAIGELEEVAAGYRDRDERLAALRAVR